MTKRIRVPKKGWVYLLKAQKKTGEKAHYKYGCTTLTPQQRCKKINNVKKGFDFRVLSEFKSNDIFSDENAVKWKILPFGLGALSEFVSITDMTDKEIVHKFQEILLCNNKTKDRKKCAGKRTNVRG